MRSPKARIPCFCLAFAFLAIASLFFSILHTNLSTQCRAPGGVPAKLESNLLEGIYHLKYDAEVLRGERDRLLNLSFSNYPVNHKTTANNKKTRIFLFAGIFSEGKDYSKRQAVRFSWLDVAAADSSFAGKFVIYYQQASSAVQVEAQEHKDIVFTADDLPVDQYIVRKTYFLLKYAVDNYDVSFVLKASDDTFVNVPAVIDELKALCKHSYCKKERIYFGKEIRNHAVKIASGDDEYMKHTSLKRYMPYMLGGGYILSSDLAQVILGINRQSKDQNLLKLMVSEDITVGFWLMSVELRRINHPGVETSSEHCCFQRIRRTPGTSKDTRVWFKTTIDICREKWLMLYRVEFADEMRYLGQRQRQCQEIELLKERALFLASAQTNPTVPVIGDGKVVRVTEGGSHSQFVVGNTHWTPVSSNDRMMLAAHVPEKLDVGEKVDVGVWKLNKDNSGWEWLRLDGTAAWNRNQGPTMFWLGISTRYFLFNDLACVSPLGLQSACGVVYDIQANSRSRVLPRPVYSVSPDGRRAVSINLQRLELGRPGFGEALSAKSIVQVQDQVRTPEDDGLWVMEVGPGHARVVVSLHRLYKSVLASEEKRQDAHSGLPYPDQGSLPNSADVACWHWVDNAKFNHEGTSVVFEYHISNCSEQSLAALPHSRTSWSYLFTVKANGEQLWRVPTASPSCFHFGRADHLLLCDDKGMYEVINRHSMTRLDMPRGVPTIDQIGACNYFHSNERFILMTASTGQAKKIMVWDRWHEKLQVIGQYTPSKGKVWGDMRRELVPLWSPSGEYIIFDSTHGGQGWQIYVAGISELGVAMLPRSRQTRYPWITEHGAAPRQVFVDVGAKRGGWLKRFLKTKWDSSMYMLHAFEPNPLHLSGLQAFARRWGVQDRLTIHNSAAWIADGQVTMSTDCDFAPRDYRNTNSGLLFGWFNWLWNGSPSTIDGSMFLPPTPTAHNITVPAVDFSTWLMKNVDSKDMVVLHMDCSGAEFDLLHKMILDGSILLVDEIHVKWYDGIREEYAEWPSLFEELLGMLNIAYTTTA